MAQSDPRASVVCRDLSGEVTLDRGPDGVRYVRALSSASATPGYRQEVQRLHQAAAKWTAPLLVGGAQTRLAFAGDGWRPFAAWRESLRREKFFPLERALRVALDLFAALQDIAAVAPGAELHTGVVLVSEAHTPSVRFLLGPGVTRSRPADFLRCSPEVLLCTPPEALCGQASARPETYVAGAALYLLLAEAPPLDLPAPALIESLVGIGLPSGTGPLPSPRLPAGITHALRAEWEDLGSLAARAAVCRPRARDVPIEWLADGCRRIAAGLDYWRLGDELCRQGRYEEACGVCRYGAWAKADDVYWRRALTRRCAEISMEFLHQYHEAAALFLHYLSHEAEASSSVSAQVRESYGDALAAQGLRHMALQQFERALPDIPDRARLLLKIADVHRRERDYVAAGRALQRLLDANPDHLEALRGMADIRVRQRDTESAREHAARALRVLKSHSPHEATWTGDRSGLLADLHALLGFCSLLHEQWEDAALLADRALEENPKCYRAYSIHGLISLSRNDMLRAMRSFHQSLLLHPDQPEVWQWLKSAVAREDGP